MKIKDIILCGLQDLKVHKKKNRIAFILIFLSIIVYIGVHSTIGGIKNGTYSTVNGHNTRILYMKGTEDASSEYEYLVNKYSEDERVQEIFKGALYYAGMVWYDTIDILGVYSQDVFFSTCYESVFNYGYKGEERLPKYNEIILPRYIYEYGIYDEYTCANTDELIGKTLTFRNEAWRYGEEGLEEYNLKVIGNYDNISKSASYYPIFANCDFISDMCDVYAERELEYYSQRGLNYDEIDGKFDMAVYIFIKEGYNIAEVQESMNGEIVDDLNMDKSSIILQQHTFMDPEVEAYYYYVIAVGNIVSFVLLFIAIINILISSLNEVKDRNWEFALKMSMGYRRRDIVNIFMVEKIANVLKALLIAFVALFLYTKAFTYYNKNMVEYWKASWIITVDMKATLISLVLVVIAALMGVVVARLSINNINISKYLKSE